MEPETLASYKQWADDLLYSCISDLPQNELEKDRAMLFGNILSLLHHVYAMDLVWKSHLSDVQHNFETRNPEISVSFAELRLKQNTINAWYKDYFTDLSQEKSLKKVNFTFIGGGPGSLSRAEIMHHAVNHSSYHRGHIEGVLYQLSIKPPTTDLPVFLRNEVT